jgi:hypothetical protein
MKILLELNMMCSSQSDIMAYVSVRKVLFYEAKFNISESNHYMHEKIVLLDLTIRPSM